MKRRQLMSATAAIGAAFIVSACCSCRNGSPKIANLETDSWKLTEFRSQNVPDSKAVTLTFDPSKKMIYGQAPCNNFFAGYTLTQERQNINIQAVGATRMFCPDTEVEDGFTRLLPDVKRVKIEGNNLLMLDASDNMLALLTAVPRMNVEQ